MLGVGGARAVAAVVVSLGFAPALAAWDLFGHHVVGAVAWEQMDEATRSAVVDLLLKAPPDSDLPRLLPPGPRPFDVRSRELFIKAQGWADLVRDEVWSKRKEKYDHPAWHYVNLFWTPGPSGPKRLEEKGSLGELLATLESSKAAVKNPRLPAEERAIALAWILHLAGDVHQPLHASGRVTSTDPEGDRGGNDFALDDLESPNLHAFWDSSLRRGRRQRHSEGYFAWVSRVARELTSLHPPETLAKEASNPSVEEWAKSGVAIAMSSAYPEWLVRGASPPARYDDEVFEIAARRATLAGYRLAGVLDELF
jgi:hypothetical protein